MRSLLLLVVVASACTKASPSTDDKHVKPLGAPIAATAPVVALATVMKDQAAFKGKPFVTTGTVTAVCQSMGCWMEIKDDTTEAHIKMAGESFFVPKTSAGHKARVQGTLTEVAGGEDVECAKEASQQLGSKIAKIELVATGVEFED